MTLPTDPKARKALPICTGVLDYFPDALAAVAALSVQGNTQHNPGEPLHWARGKSTDQADTIVRHLMERGTLDTDGVRHSTKVAWRALAQLQLEIEESMGLPISRGSSPAEPAPSGEAPVGASEHVPPILCDCTACRADRLARAERCTIPRCGCGGKAPSLYRRAPAPGGS